MHSQPMQSWGKSTSMALGKYTQWGNCMRGSGSRADALRRPISQKSSHARSGRSAYQLLVMRKKVQPIAVIRTESLNHTPVMMASMPSAASVRMCCGSLITNMCTRLPSACAPSTKLCVASCTAPLAGGTCKQTDVRAIEGECKADCIHARHRCASGQSASGAAT